LLGAEARERVADQLTSVLPDPVFIWPELESLSLLLCHKALADVFIDG
jgi:hypothetical protein